MSTTTAKRTHSNAVDDAVAFRSYFGSCYEKWEIAGSLRRRAAEVSDVDHVVIPKLAEKPGPGLFAEPVKVNLMLERLDELVADGVITKHVYGMGQTDNVVIGRDDVRYDGPSRTVEIHRWGPKYRGADFRGFNHEVSLCDADNWGSKLAIKTGPEEFSKLLVTRLYLQHYRNKDGYVWRCGPCAVCGKRDKDCKACEGTGLVPAAHVSVPTERDYFALASVPYLEPHARR